jgi:hypothetical protein
MPTFILGGKGSGKTHLMRYASYPLQKLRYQKAGIGVADGLRRDGYVGIYIKFTGLETGRFLGKGQSNEAWLEVFSYYMELCCGIAAISIIEDALARQLPPKSECELCAAIADLFNVSPPAATTLADVSKDLDRRRKALDYQVSNAAFTGQLQPEIAISRGRLIFGLPQQVHRFAQCLEGVLFAYQLDEFENLTVDQQRHVNSLVRDRQGPSSLKVGARQFGIRTRATLSAGEENVKDSEFDELRLDQRFRNNERVYSKLVTQLVERRLETFGSVVARKNIAGGKLEQWFAEPDNDWNATRFKDIVASGANSSRKQLHQLRVKLVTFLGRGVPGLKSTDQIDEVISLISCEPYPLLEKLNVTLIFNAWARGRTLLDEAKSISENARAFIAGRPQKAYQRKLEHFKLDLISQMKREADEQQEYAGLKTFVRMSEGQPRALITLLKQTFDWAAFQGERPFESNVISVDAQSKGAQAAAEWFYNSMRNAGDAERAVQTAVNRLAELFRINRYADNPMECSLIGFSANYSDASPEAASTLKFAIDRSFIVEVTGGQQERNNESVTTKYQLNRMLVPRWGLPTGRRGLKPFNAFELNAIFDPGASSDFESLKSDWDSRMNAPFTSRRRPLASEMVERNSPDQSDLFP